MRRKKDRIIGQQRRKRKREKGQVAMGNWRKERRKTCKKGVGVPYKGNEGTN